MADFFSTLSEEQQQAVRHAAGPALIVAGPGTGKTRVLIGRILELVMSRQTDPSSILAITFTTKAADEMRQRVDAHLPPRQAAGMIIGTFHALGYRVLLEHAALRQRSAPFSLVDEVSRTHILKELLPAGSNRALRKTAAALSAAKHTAADLPPEIAAVARAYNQFLITRNAFDLDDLLRQTVELWQNHADILQVARRRWTHILVDEFQDTNYLQYRLLRLLCPDATSNLFIIGDPDQAIYGFRGADGYIQQLRSDYPGLRSFRLSRSYRCGTLLLQTARQTLPEPRQPPLSGLSAGMPVKIACLPTDRSEAEYISRSIEQLIGGTGFFSFDSGISDGHAPRLFSPGDLAILCRTRAQFPLIKGALNQHGIPCQCVSEVPFYHAAACRQLIQLFQSCLNPAWIAPPHSALPPNFFQRTAELPLAALLEKLAAHVHGHTPELWPESVQQLIAFAAEYTDKREEFLTLLSLGGGIDTWTRRPETVSLLTIHAAKGLEFAGVFIAGCEDGLIPYTIFPEHAGDETEERRLLYVGMTRAKELLVLCHAQRRRLFGRNREPRLSHFLDTVDCSVIEPAPTPNSPRRRSKEKQLRLF
ncbi:MAG: ATP-dependent helicase [Candidatus Omnitrophica bacterium]|nr:ATP-dependent helicase [Candidatus Omnitrophota bacterium]